MQIGSGEEMKEESIKREKQDKEGKKKDMETKKSPGDTM